MRMWRDSVRLQIFPGPESLTSCGTRRSTFIIWTTSSPSTSWTTPCWSSCSPETPPPQSGRTLNFNRRRCAVTLEGGGVCASLHVCWSCCTHVPQKPNAIHVRFSVHCFTASVCFTQSSRLSGFSFMLDALELLFSNMFKKNPLISSARRPQVSPELQSEDVAVRKRVWGGKSVTAKSLTPP